MPTKRTRRTRAPQGTLDPHEAFLLYGAWLSETSGARAVGERLQLPEEFRGLFFSPDVDDDGFLLDDD